MCFSKPTDDYDDYYYDEFSAAYQEFMETEQYKQMQLTMDVILRTAFNEGWKAAGGVPLDSDLSYEHPSDGWPYDPPPAKT